MNHDRIIDHGEYDHLTPPSKPSEVDQAIARQIRRSLSLVPSTEPPLSLPQQMARNGLSVHGDPFAWLQS